MADVGREVGLALAETSPERRLEALGTLAGRHGDDPEVWFHYASELAKQGHRDAAASTRLRLMALDAERGRALDRVLGRAAPRVASLRTGTVEPTGEQGALAGRTVGPYRFVREIARAPSELLYDGEKIEGGRLVTLRIILDLPAAAAEKLMKRHQEIGELPGFAAVLDVVPGFELDGGKLPVEVLRRLRGTTLRDLRARKIDFAYAVEMVRCAATVLAKLQARGLPHGDLRPEHVVCCDAFVPPEAKDDETQRVRLLGPGLIDPDPKQLLLPEGRVGWMAPEEGISPADARTDVYGLGLLLQYLVTGEEPRPLAERLRGELPEIRESGAAAPRLHEVLQKCLAPAPGDRLADAAAVAEELAHIDEVRATDLAGQTLGKWKLEEMVGEGGFGAVYQASHTSIPGLRAAVKVVHPHIARDPALRRRFLADAAKAGELEQPGIADFKDGDIDARGICWVASELVPGKTLTAEVAAGALPAERALRLARVLASGLGAAHDAGVVHGDVKPDNVMVARPGTPGEEPKLVDFGVARLRGAAAGGGRGQSGPLVASPEYMAPELWQALPDIDGRADIYALGILLWQCVAGRHPFSASSVAEWQRAHLETPLPPLPGRPKLSALCSRLAAKPREQRPGSMHEAEALIAALLAEGDETAARPDPPKTDPPKTDPPKTDPPKTDPPKLPVTTAAGKRSPWPWLAGGVGLAAAIALAILLWPRKPGTPAALRRLTTLRGAIGVALAGDHVYLWTADQLSEMTLADPNPRPLGGGNPGWRITSVTVDHDTPFMLARTSDRHQLWYRDGDSMVPGAALAPADESTDLRITADERGVYAVGDGHAVYGMSRTGSGPAQTLNAGRTAHSRPSDLTCAVAPAPEPDRIDPIEVWGDSLFWVHGCAVRRMGLRGGEIWSVFPEGAGARPHALSVTRGKLLVAGAARVAAYPFGNRPADEAAFFPTDAVELASGGDLGTLLTTDQGRGSVYYLDRAAGTVMSVPVAGGRARRAVQLAPEDGGAIAFDLGPQGLLVLTGAGHVYHKRLP